VPLEIPAQSETLVLKVTSEPLVAQVPKVPLEALVKSETRVLKGM
jgi:hypothetical protein